jgi:pimeloyl-ACP methyl ester carboxylesterase
MELPTFRVAWVLWPAAVWLLWVTALFLLQRRMIFPRHLLNPPRAGLEAPPGAERVVLDTPLGPGLAFYLPPAVAATPGVDLPGGAVAARSEGDDSSGVMGVRGDGDDVAAGAPALIFAHGNAELARDWAGAYRSVAGQGVAVLLVEFPGYGEAPGEPTLESVAAVMVAAYDHLVERPEVDERRVVGLGRSLGGGAITELARRRPLAGLVLQSTFTRMADFARRFLAPRALIRDPFDNLTLVEAFEGPVLLFHGEEDRVIPYEHGRRLAAAARDGEMVTWPCGHNDCPPNWTGYTRRVVAFVKGIEPVGPARF